MSQETERQNLPPAEAVALADAALGLMAAFFTNPSALAAFLAERVMALDAGEFLDLPEVAYVDASEVLRLWESRAAYLDTRAEPAVLPLHGPWSFAALSREACPTLAPEVVLATLERGRAVECMQGDGGGVTSVRMTGRAALVQKAEQAAHARAARMAARYLDTLRGNLGPGTSAERLFERSAVVTGLPESRLPAVKAFLARHGQQFLEDGDDTLARLADAAAGTEPDVGIGLFLFRDAPDKAR